MVENNPDPNAIEQRIAETQQSPEQGSDGNKTSEYSQIAGIISDLDRRLRVLEERYGNLRKRIQLTDQNVIEAERSFGKELRSFNDETLELKRSMSDFSDKVLIFTSEMENVAQKSDLRILEKYLAMWNPGMFVTRRELKEYLKSKNVKVLDEDSGEDSNEEETEQ